MQVDVVSSEAGFEALAGDWNRLAGPNPFDRFDWNRLWWQTYGDTGRLAIHVVRDAERAVAIAPWYAARRHGVVSALQFLANGKACSDYRRVLFDPTLDADARRTAMRELAAYCRSGSASACDLIELEGLDLADPSAALLGECLAEHGFKLVPQALESSWTVSLPRKWQDFVAPAPRGLRRKINKAIRRAQEPEVTFHQTATSVDTAEMWDEFVRLHQLRFSKKVDDGGCFVEPRFQRFLRSAVSAMADDGAAKFIWCSVAGKPISIQLYFFNDDTAFMYQSGFDPAYSAYEPGHLLYTHVFEKLISEGYAKLDFLRGNESYKADWNALPLPLTRLRCISPRATSRMRWGLLDLARGAHRAVQRLRQADVAGAPGCQTCGKPAADAPIAVEAAKADETLHV